ncbi:MAG: helix-turn-helix transcriptional regulator [Oleispira sp.]|nr:helix-turn-helix transcriptional regulator [Oleispira sp.]MBL4881674.1 helix-turn-helix transcriptional regulator [Oleispira sp.]
MNIEINLDIVMAKRKIRLKTLAQEVGITEQNLSILKNNKAKAIRFSTLDKLCEVLECQPGDILVYKKNESI